MFHSNSWSYPWGMAAVGGTNVCLRKLDGATIFNLIRRHNVTHMCAAPVVLNMLSNTPDVKPLKNPVHIMTGGAPPPGTGAPPDRVPRFHCQPRVRADRSNGSCGVVRLET